jgi:spermidine synthase
LRAIPFIAFFLSGATSLTFQTLWTRMLHHTFGATSIAMSSVLTAFMGGLGLGAHWFGKRAHRFRRPLVVYALCELGVALFALVIPWVVRPEGPLAHLNRALRASLGETSLGFMVARFACVLPVLIVPTTLMGGTLPLLARHFVRADGAEGAQSSSAGTLYAINTLGAVAGSLVASFWLMPAVGVSATNLCAVGGNIGLAGLVLWLARRAPAQATPAASQHSVNGPALALGTPTPRTVRQLTALGFAVSGACAMAAEVVWSRALSMAIGSSMHAFALILVTFLVGIALGSAAVSHLLSEDRPAPRSLHVALVVGAVGSALALVPVAVLKGGAAFALLLGASLTFCAVRFFLAASRARDLMADEDLQPVAEAALTRAARSLLALPACLSAGVAAYAWLSGQGLSDVARHGFLPWISASVVLSLSAFGVLLTELHRRPATLAAAVQLYIAIATLACAAFQDEIPYTFARLVTSLGDLSSHVEWVRFFMFFTAALCTLPATLGMGAMFPLTLRVYRNPAHDVAHDVGVVYASNTAGSILGAWLPGFVLMPALGLQRTIELGVLLNAAVSVVIALSVLRLMPMQRRGALSVFAAGTLTCAGALYLCVAPNPPLRWNLSHMTLGAFRVSLAREVIDPTSWGNPDLVYYRDGVSTTVSVERWGRHLSLKNNGKVDASNGDDMPTQIMVGAYPLLLHPRGPSDLDVAVVGFGSGVTVGAVLEFPVRSVESMELEGAVVEAGATYFGDVSHLPKKRDSFPFVEEPRLRLHNDDGRNFLASTRASYDVIVSEPSNPWITGVSDLFTEEHFRLSKQRLRKGGVYCQWVQLYEMSPENIKTIYRTFANHFRYVAAFAAEELSSDTILVGSDSPLPLSLPHLARSMDNARVRAELERAYIHSPYDALSRMLFASREELLAFTVLEERLVDGRWVEQMRATGKEPCPAMSCRRRPADRNTDDNMLVELRAPRDLIGFARYEGYLRLFYGPTWPYGDVSRAAGLDGDGERIAFALALLAHGRPSRAAALLEGLTLAPSGLAPELAAARALLGQVPAPRPALDPVMLGVPLDPGVKQRFMEMTRLIVSAVEAEDYPRAMSLYSALPAPLRSLSGPGFRVLYGLVSARTAGGDKRKLKTAAAEIEAVMRRDSAYLALHPELYFLLAQIQYEAQGFDRAVRNMLAYARITAPAPEALSR